MAKTKRPTPTPNYFSVSVEMGNAAFDDGNGPAEVARILRKIADDIEATDSIPEHAALRDINGNTVGAVTTR